LFGTATDAAAGDAFCAFATVPSAAMERMAVVASNIFIIPLDQDFGRRSALRGGNGTASEASTNGI
jgi:hypothetical protein